MRILILGGTGWLGGHIARVALEAGHTVTCLARRVEVPDGAHVVAADRDADGALQSVAGEHWDSVIDLATQPGHVRRMVRDLAGAVDHAVFISTVSVYADNGMPAGGAGSDETAAVHVPLAADEMVDMSEYGAAKVAGEIAVREGFGADRSLIVRPGLIGGPGDPSGRTDYWPWRFAHPAVPGLVLTPDAPALPTSVIDVRDLAAFVVHAVEQRAHGVMNALGDAVSFVAHLDTARAAVGDAAHDITAIAVDEAWLLEAGVAEWAGPRSLPLWLADRAWYGMNLRSNAAARDAGLTLRPLVDTLRDGLAWRSAHPHTKSGLTDAEEIELLERLRG